ncbi:MAG: WD40 repeat domain-containing protein [Pirellulales bacterium]
MSHPSGFRPQWLPFGRSQVIGALLIASIVCTVWSPVLAQRRATRGDRGAASDRGGYGAAGYGGVGASRDSTGSGDTAPKGPATYPERAADASAGPLGEYQKPTYDHYRFVVSPDGAKLALSGRHLTKEPAAAKGPSPKSKSASGKPVVAAHVMEVIDIPTGRPLVSFKPPALFENLALSPDNNFLAAESTDRPGVINVLHLPTRKSKEFKTNLRRILPGGIVFARDGRSINVLGADRLLTIALGDGATKELKYEVTTPAASYSAATNILATGVSRSSRGKPEVQIFDVAAGKEIEQLAVPTAPVRLQFSTDGSRLVAVVAGGVLRAWQTGDWMEVELTTTKIGIDPGQLAVSPDGSRVAVLPRIPARTDSKVIDISTGDVVQTVRALDAYFLPSGALAVASTKGPFYLDLTSGNLAELPPGAGDAALAQSGVGASSYGDTSAQSPPAGQAGYGAVPPEPSNNQPGYGVVTPPPTNDQPGYGVVTPPSPPSPDQSGRR